MDYATTHSSGAAAHQAGTAREINKPLECLPSAVQRVNTCTVRVQHFLDRFHGEGPAEPTAAAPPTPEPVLPHNVTINQLFAALDRLETRVEALNQIG